MRTDSSMAIGEAAFRPTNTLFVLSQPTDENVGVSQLRQRLAARLRLMAKRFVWSRQAQTLHRTQQMQLLPEAHIAELVHRHMLRKP